MVVGISVFQIAQTLEQCWPLQKPHICWMKCWVLGPCWQHLECSAATWPAATILDPRNMGHWHHGGRFWSHKYKHSRKEWCILLLWLKVDLWIIVAQVKVYILMGRPRLPGYMFVLSFFPACIVSVSPRGTFEKHEKWIQMDDLVCSLDMCYVRQSVFEQTHCLHAKDYFKSCQESWETRILKIITRTIVLNRAVPQGSLLMWKELLLAKVAPVNKCVSVICRILRTTPPMTLYTILPFWV